MLKWGASVKKATKKGGVAGGGRQKQSGRVDVWKAGMEMMAGAKMCACPQFKQQKESAGALKAMQEIPQSKDHNPIKQNWSELEDNV